MHTLHSHIAHLRALREQASQDLSLACMLLSSRGAQRRAGDESARTALRQAAEDSMQTEAAIDRALGALELQRRLRAIDVLCTPLH